MRLTFILAGVLLGSLALQAVAVTPESDRAKVESMEATLVLPDYSKIVVNMDFDCGSDFSSTAMIITSDHGANMLSELYTYRYGKAAGKKVLQEWNSKKTPDDPRKPTFLIVTKPITSNVADNAAKSSISVASTGTASETVNGFCGTYEHKTNQL